MTIKNDYRSILQKELEARKLRNSSYNLSSFARLLEIAPSRLSEILRGKVGISVSKASTISSILNFSETERLHFLDLVCAEHGRSPKEKQDALARIDKYYNNYQQFSNDQFEYISDWYNHAIVELITLNPRITNAEISEALGIELKKINEATERLIKYNVIELTLNGYKIPAPNRETTRDIPSDAIKKLNEQILKKATKELYDQPVDNRDFSIVFFGFNKYQLKIAKERIRDFRRSFMNEFESSIGKNSVYCMGVQLFELTEKEITVKTY